MNRHEDVAASPLRIAYADPPYPGCAHLYADHPDYNGEVDHEALITELVGYDGWALSTSSKALQQILFFCPEHVRVLVWVKNTVRYAWELGAEPQDDFADLFPGSGAVGRAWERFAAEIPLRPAEAPNLRSSKRAQRKALREHPTLEAT